MFTPITIRPSRLVSVRLQAVTVDKLADGIAEVNRSEERDKRLGDRIEALASAIAEFVRRAGPPLTA